MEIFIQTEISVEESEQLFGWDERVFPIEGRAYSWAKSKCHIIAKDKGVAIGHIGFGQFQINAGETEKNVIGVGGVVVRPEYQGKKIPEKMFETLNNTDSLNSRNMIKALFCPRGLIPYYERHGYKEYCHPVSFLQGDNYTATNKFCFMIRGDIGLSCAVSIPSNPW
jgi:predicted N-acetyltransferase YhbS